MSTQERLKKITHHQKYSNESSPPVCSSSASTSQKVESKMLTSVNLRLDFTVTACQLYMLNSFINSNML